MSHSIRFTTEDLQNIAKIQLDRGGISFPAAVRVALKESASKKPEVAVLPMMASPTDLKEFLKALASYSDDLVYVAETGLPLDQPGTSEAERKELSLARGKFRAIQARTEKMQLELELFRRMVVALPRCDVVKLKGAAHHIWSRNMLLKENLAAGKLGEKEARAAEFWTRDCYGPLLEWLAATGLLPPQN